MESFGNKHSVMVNSIQQLPEMLRMLNKDIDVEEFPFLKVDVAMSISKDNYMTFASKKILHSLKAHNSYNVFLNKNLTNCHRVTRILKDGELTIENNEIEKLNFYNEVENILDVSNSYKFIPKGSVSVFKSNLFNHYPLSTSLKENQRCLSNLNSMVDGLITTSIKEFAYRIEVRIPIKKVEPHLKSLLDTLAGKEFLFYETEPMLRILYNTTKKLLTKIGIVDRKVFI